MIHSLRQRHRRTFLTLGIFLPIAFAVAIAARKRLPEVNALPPELAPASATYANEVSKRVDLFSKGPVEVRLLREKSGAGKFVISLSAPRDYVKPDLLVYWSAGNAASTNALPDNAILLGAFGTSQLPLPVVAESSEGVLILFSLADNEVVDVSKPVRLNTSTQ